MTRPPSLRARYRPQPIAEIDIHLSIASLLRRTCNPCKWVWTHIGHGEKRDPKTSEKLYRMGVKPGWPDFIFIAWTGHIYFLEIKSKTGELSDHQRAFFSAMRVWNIECRVARSIEEAIRILGGWGVIPVRIEDAA